MVNSTIDRGFRAGCAVATDAEFCAAQPGRVLFHGESAGGVLFVDVLDTRREGLEDFGNGPSDVLDLAASRDVGHRESLEFEPVPNERHRDALDRSDPVEQNPQAFVFGGLIWKDLRKYGRL